MVLQGCRVCSVIDHACALFHGLSRADPASASPPWGPDLVQQHRAEWNRHFFLPDTSLVLTQPQVLLDSRAAELD